MYNALLPSHIATDTVLAEDDTGDTLTRAEFSGLGADWATRIPGRCVVAILCSNTTKSLRAYAGIHTAGHVIILLSAKIAEAALADIVARFAVEVIVQGDTITRVAEPAGQLHPDLSVCLSTSGSTGSPKLVRFSTRQLVANAQAIAQYLSLDETERPLAHLPYEYSFGLSVLHSHMSVGAKVLLTEHSIMQKPFWERLAEATSLAGVPFHFEMLLRMRLGRANLPNLRSLTQAGGRLRESDAVTLYNLAHDKGWGFHIMYGQTEAGPRMTWLPFDRMDGNFDCIGQPIPGVALSLSDTDELIASSPAIMMGYGETRADLARGDDLNGTLHTGDLAEITQSGLFRITGRKSRFIKLQGNRVSLSNIEARMEAQGFEVCCVGQDDALSIFTEDTDTEAVRQTAITSFSFPARSMKVIHVPSLPRLPNGKMDYTTLLEQAKDI